MLFYINEADIPNSLFLREQSNLKAAPHFHESIEFILLKKGHVRAFVKDREIPFSDGAIFYVPSFAIHHYEWEGEIDALVMMVSSTYLTTFKEDFPHSDFPLLMNDVTKNQEIFALVEEWNRKGSTQHLTNVGYFNLLASAIVKNYPLRQGDQDVFDETLSVKLVQYINAHYQEDLSLESLSNVFYRSVEYISKCIHTIIGRNFRDYLNQIRLKQVFVALANNKGEKSLQQIVSEAGFTSLPTYYRAKKRYFEDEDVQRQQDL